MGSLKFPYQLVTMLMVAGLLLVPGRSDAVPRSGQAAPDFKVISTSGQQISMEKYRGHVLVLDFFATWCEPCRAAIPHLVEMNRKYGKQGLYVLGMSADEDGEKVVKAFAEKNHISYPVALAGESTLADFGVRALDESFGPGILVTATEKRTKREIDHFVEAVAKVVS